MRDGWVWMNGSLGRLERVDVILRRVDAAWSDPLELRGDSQLGVAGLAEAVRRGHVRVVNGLGAGVLENPALLPFLPAVCEHAARRAAAAAVGADASGAATPRSQAHVLDDLDDLVVRRIDGSAADLADLPRTSCGPRSSPSPHRFVGQERLPLSQAPTWGDGRTSAAAYARSR